MLDLLYEDSELLVLNKPVGLLVHTGAGVHPDEKTLADYLVAYCPSMIGVGEDAQRYGIVHRLDRDTEGVMVVAKTQTAFEHLKAQFQAHSIEKRYYALVYGSPRDDYWEISAPIGRHPKKRHLFAVQKDGKPAITKVTVLKRFGSTSLLDVEILTGRTHQIRVHLAHCRFPVVGDPTYSGHAHKGGQKLQAYCLGFVHPGTGVRMRFLVTKSL